jgi:hypothetical protein
MDGLSGGADEGLKPNWESEGWLDASMVALPRTDVLAGTAGSWLAAEAAAAGAATGAAAGMSVVGGASLAVGGMSLTAGTGAGAGAVLGATRGGGGATEATRAPPAGT